MASLPPPRSFGQPAPSTYEHSSAGSSSQQRVPAGRRSSKQQVAPAPRGPPKSESGSQKSESGFQKSESGSQKSESVLQKNVSGSSAQQRRSRALKDANQRMSRPGKLANSGSAPVLAGAHIVGDASKSSAGKLNTQDEVRRHDVSLPINDDVAVLQQHLLGPEAATGASEGVAVPPLHIACGPSNSKWRETPNFGGSKEVSSANSVANSHIDAGAHFASQDETANFGRAREDPSSGLRIEQNPKRSPAASPWIGSLNSSSSAPVLLPPAQPASLAEEHRASGISSRAGADPSSTKVAALEMELRLLQNRLAAETRAHQQLAEVVADDAEKQRILENQLNESRSENRRLQVQVEKAEERARYSEEMAKDLQQLFRKLEDTTEFRLKKERSRAHVIARLEGILPKSTLLKALA